MKKFIRLVCAFTVLLIFIAGFALVTHAATIKWVDQVNGSDGNNGNTESTAYKTLQFTIDNSTSGSAITRSIINVKDGTYGVSGGQANADHCGEGGFLTAILIEDLDFLTIQAVKGNEPVVQPDAAANIVSITIENSKNVTIDNIDSDQTIAQFDNWHVCDSDGLTVRKSKFTGGEDGIDFTNDLTVALIEYNTFIDVNTGNGDEVLDFTDGSYSEIVIQDNYFQNSYRQITIFPPGENTASGFIIRRNVMNGTNVEEAVRFIGANNILFENNVVFNSEQQGLYIDTGSTNITVRHNTFFNNGFEEIRAKETGTDIVIANNILHANGTFAAIGAAVSPLLQEDFNLVFNNGSDTQSGSQPAVTSFGANTITGSDPLFISTTPGSEDLRLQAGSPAIEAGADLGVSDDNTKNTRPNPAGTVPDIGAFEFGPATSIDHFQCYDIKNPSKLEPEPVVSLTDQFTSEEDIEVHKKAESYCTPVDKNGEGIQNFDSTLTCYRIDSTQKQLDVVIENQFGQQEFELKKTETLCVPSRQLSPLSAD